MDITGVFGRFRPGPPLIAVLAAFGILGCANIEATASAARATATPDPPPMSSTTPSPTPPPYATPGARLVPLNGRPVGTPAMGRPLSDARVAEVLELLIQRDPDRALLEEALDEIVRERDVRFIAPLIELMRAGPMQLAELTPEHVAALRALSGWGHSLSWDRWLEWYGETDLTPPLGFATWKGRLLAHLDARYAAMLADDRSATIPVEQLIWSGLVPDGTEPLDDPAFVEGDSAGARYLDPAEPVFGVFVNGEARAFPLRIMDVHEIANGTIGGIPVTLAYCTLTGSSVLFDRRAPDGRTYSFSTSGLIYESNRMMYDRETGSLWNPLTGRPVLGAPVDEAGSGTGPWLDPHPVVTARWGDWLARHPDTLVLDADTGSGHRYSLGFPYLDYFSSGNTMFPVSQRDDRQLTKAWVYGMLVGGTPRAFPLRTVLREQVVNDRVGDQEVVLVGEGSGRGIRVTGEMPSYGEVRYFAGGAIRAYARPEGVTFEPGPDALTVIDEAGRAWAVEEDGLISPEGEVAPRLFGQLTYWFGWRFAHPTTSVYDSLQPAPAP